MLFPHVFTALLAFSGLPGATEWTHRALSQRPWVISRWDRHIEGPFFFTAPGDHDQKLLAPSCQRSVQTTLPSSRTSTKNVGLELHGGASFGTCMREDEIVRGWGVVARFLER